MASFKKIGSACNGMDHAFMEIVFVHLCKLLGYMVAAYSVSIQKGRRPCS